ncbi:MAG: hypothetical protein JWP89_6350 [Schlesneria sp.]|nr:hypothetical protein [Schlesneria sp.]
MKVSLARLENGSLSAESVRSIARLAVRLGCAMLTVFALGCAEEKPKFPVATIQGTVSIDGKPVKEGSLQFMPGKDVKGQVAQAKIADGKFTAKNVPVGQVRVMFNITRATGKMITEYSTPYPEIENLVPKDKRDGVDLAVAGNDNVKFDLLNESGSAADSTAPK